MELLTPKLVRLIAPLLKTCNYPLGRASRSFLIDFRVPFFRLHLRFVCLMSFRSKKKATPSFDRRQASDIFVCLDRRAKQEEDKNRDHETQ